MRARCQTGIERQHAMFKQARLPLGNRGLEEGLVLRLLEYRPFQERDHFVQNRDVASELNVICGGISKPNAIITDARADAAFRFRQPPMLDVSLAELPRG